MISSKPKIHGRYVHRTLRISTLALCVALLAPVSAAAAQDASAGAQSEGSDVIVVTAQRRSESLQTVPIAITAFTSGQLEAANIRGPADLEQATPGVIFGESGRDGQIFVRGIGSTRLSGAGADPSSSVYVDGVYRSRGTSALLDFVDLERVEVLRGPQGTLYGRNSTGGAVRYISEPPKENFGGKVVAGYGAYDALRLIAQVDVPVAPGLVAVRATFMHSERSGYTKNLLRRGETFGRQNLEAGRIAARITPSSNLTIDVHAGFSDDESDQTALKHYIDPLGPFGRAKIIADPRKVNSDYGPRMAPINSWYVDGTMTLDLGSMVLTSITGYNSIDVGPYTGDLDVTEIAGITDGRNGQPNGIADGGNTFSQEITLGSSGKGPFQWSTGLYYLHDDNYTLRQGLYVALIPVLAANHTTYNAFGKTSAYAGFANLSYFLTDHIRVNAGLRYSKETKRIDRARYLNFNLLVGPVRAKKGWDAWTPKIGIDYVIDANKMIYASYSRGFKSGAFNASSFDPAVNPENVDAFEAGVKLRFPEARLTLNSSAFVYSYRDLQVQGLDPNNLGVEIVRNAARARLKGGEVEMAWRPVDPLSINMGVAVLDAKYRDFPTLAGNLAGNRLPNAPKLTFNAGVAYTQALGTFGDLVLSGDYYHSSRRFLSETNNSFNAMQPAYDLLGARITLRPDSKRWELSFYGKNLTNTVVFSRTVTQTALLRTGFLAYIEPPRTYGAELKINF